MKKKCQMCRGLHEPKGPWGEPPEANATVTIRMPPGYEKRIYKGKQLYQWEVCDTCAATVQEFIEEFQEDVKTRFKDQEDLWKLRYNPRLQSKLPEVQ